MYLMVKVCDIENIKYYRCSSIIQKKWRKHINRKNKYANIIIQYWKIFKKNQAIKKVFLLIFLHKKINDNIKKIQCLWRNKHMKIRIQNNDCPISLIPLKDIEWNKKILLEYDEIIYGFSMEELFDYYISGNKVICPFTRRDLRYFEMFNIIKKKYPEINLFRLKLEEQLLVVNNFMLSIENVINRQEDFDNTVIILTEQLELHVVSAFRSIIFGIWNSNKQMKLNNDFLKILITAYRFEKFNSFERKKLCKELKSNILEKIDIYFRNFCSLYFVDDIEDSIIEMIKSIFSIAIKKAFIYCSPLISVSEENNNIISFIMDFTDNIVSFNNC